MKFGKARKSITIEIREDGLGALETGSAVELGGPFARFLFNAARDGRRVEIVASIKGATGAGVGISLGELEVSGADRIENTAGSGIRFYLREPFANEDPES